MNFLSIFTFVSGLIILAFGFLVFLKGKNIQGRIPFFLFTCSVFLWLGSYSQAYRSNQFSISLFWFKIGYLGVIFIPPTWSNFIWYFRLSYLRLKFTTRIKTLIFLFYLASFYFSSKLLFSNQFINDLYEYNWGFYPKVPAVFHLIFLLFFQFAFGSTLVILMYDFLSKSQKISQIQRIRIKYLLLGVSIGAFASIDFLPNYGFSIIPFGFIFMVPFPLIYSYAIIRYRLLDISLAVTRTGIFIAVYSLVLGAPFVVAYSFRPYLIGLLGEAWWLVPMGLMTVLATVGPFVYIYINKKAEDRLMREQRRYQSTLRQASSGMIRVRELKRLLNLIVHVVTRTVGLEFSTVFLHDSDNHCYSLAAKRGKTKFVAEYTLKDDSFVIGHLIAYPEPIVFEEIQLRSQDNPADSHLAGLEKELSYLNAAVIVPSFVGKQLLGCLVLGKKLSGKLYSQDDLNVFSVLANQSALAIENAQFYEDIKETQEQLFQAEKMATIGTMADGLSHQINNRFQALSLIAGDSVDILKTTDVSQCSQEVKDSFTQLQHAFARILSNVMQGGEVVRGLLRYSRPGQEGFDSIIFNQVIDGALEMVQYKIRITEIDIKRNIPDGLPKIRCNLTQLEEVFFNLVDNAYDAIKEKQAILKDPGYRGTIEISAFQEDGNVRIVFKDNGAGVAEKDKEKLFTPFFTTKASNHRGTGLGLYVIHKIIGHHSGTVFIDSTHMQGTKFEIMLPASQ